MDIAPSILTADFTELGQVLDEAIDAGITWVHLDVMDGNWVVNKTITFGPAVVRSIRERLGEDVFIDCHLMITNAEETWEQYADAGANLIIAHIEAIEDPEEIIDEIRRAGKEVGLVLNPDTDVGEVLPYLADLDLVLVMSVVPGKGGQSFMPEVEDKVRHLRSKIDHQVANGGRRTKLMIDGGVKANNAKLVSSWGVDIAVVGSGLINKAGSIKDNLEEITSSL
ncbi:MAG: ribulose-phosphate 3-epimerase [Candidatus Thalassarchaeaceae archaeon]|jgi:ribulose-phosphate 3-epimerase|nr:ribulose-phosphate 3-epimerase [Euryarchaeota archaeon]NDB93210.1 ribulose-phosphate 3-epimerase [Euryarchaeota archaeon]NDF21838.1 ribulose-phosphate 3-epimerase [Euryarchaeota archaeon]NDF36499.1 ribulose-phosphate 3-epimerase [Euryarchaeota archaeon]NDG21363.1 ribulose-phosphate 3-epimerase [Euryarchaeota archaeon]